MASHTEIGEFIWRIADHLRGDYEKNDNEDEHRVKVARAGYEGILQTVRELLLS